MPFDHACFISYRSHGQSALAGRFINEFSEALQNELAVMLDEDVYVDRERIKGGAFFNTALARALCKSVCMVVIFTPTYFSKAHTYCAREFKAMEELEAQRLALLNHIQPYEQGLIFPVVLRGQAHLPSYIKDKRQFYSFERFTLSTRQLSKNRQFEANVQKLASDIYERRKLFEQLGSDVCTNCEAFAFPTEVEILSWLDSVLAPAAPFPLREQL